MKKFIVSLVILCFGYTSVHAQSTAKELSITYIANEGFLLKTQEHKILIDALFSEGYGYFAHPAANVINQIMNAAPPFDSIELCLLTHYHKDHADSKLIKDYLQKYPYVKLVTTKPSLVFIDGEQFGFVKLKKQFCEITPDTDKFISQTINHIPIKVLGFKHLTNYQDGVNVEEYMFNVGYYINLNGIKILHTGDTDMKNFKEYIHKNGQWKEPVDVAFIYYEILNSQADLDYILKTLHPENIVIMHVPPSLNKEWENKTEQLKQSFPNIFLFNTSLENKIIKIK